MLIAHFSSTVNFAVYVDHVETTWHSMGTCAMKPRETDGVVDKRLNVYGTENLKCADLSICPVREMHSLQWQWIGALVNH